MMVRTVVEVLRIVVIIVMFPVDLTWVMGLSLHIQIIMVDVCLRYRIMKQIQVFDVLITDVVKNVLVNVFSDYSIFLLCNLVFIGISVSISVSSLYHIVLVTIGVMSTSSMSHIGSIAVIIRELVVIERQLL